jgi:WD40-like Beta Propeller Repeat
MRVTRALAALMWVAAACTQTPTSTNAPASSVQATQTLPPSVSTTVSPVPIGATLGDGTALPDGCTGKPDPSETVAFVAEGVAWALDPVSSRLDCLFEVQDPGPFAWGPQGDRVLLGDFEVRGVGARAPDFPAIGSTSSTFDWGHPIGLAVVFATPSGTPQKRYMDDGRVDPLPTLPDGDYLHIAYHPSGLALAFVLERKGKQSIWISTNEGEDPQRLVFSEEGTEFTSIAFSPDGQQLLWMAEHRQGYPEFHWMDLADRSRFGAGWRGRVGRYADDLLVAPRGSFKSVNEGTICEQRHALILTGNAVSSAMPGETRPTSALGWLDGTTLLVSAGGCGDTVDLYSVDASGKRDPLALALGVDLGATRTRLVNAPTEVPAPPGAEEEAPPGGLG